MQTQMPAPSQKPAPASLLNPGFVGGASYMQQGTNVYDGSPAVQGQMIDMMHMFGQSTRTTEQHQKDFRKLESSLIKMCTH